MLFNVLLVVCIADGLMCVLELIAIEECDGDDVMNSVEIIVAWLVCVLSFIAKIKEKSYV